MSSTSLKNRAIRGTIWTVFGFGSSQVLRFASNLVLTRLLVPELFGLMALVQVFIRGLVLFSDVGIIPNIVRSDRGDDPIFLNTAWTIQVIRGFALWLGCFVITYPIAQFYGDNRLLWLIPVVGLNSILEGFNSTSLATLNRRMEYSRIAQFELGTQLVSLAVLIAWAWLSPTIWALVGGTIFSAALKMLVSHKINPWGLNSFVWNKEAVKEIISFGKWIFIATAMTFLASQADRIILSKFFSLEMLGVYVIAFTFADIPRQVGQKIGSKVIFPTISKLISIPRRRLQNKISSKRTKVVIALAILLSLLSCFGDFIVFNLYDSRYEQAAWMLPILALGLWPILLAQTEIPILLALGKPRYIAIGHLSKFIYMLVVLPLGIAKTGIVGAMVIIAFNDLPLYVAINFGLWREKIVFVVQDAILTLSFASLTMLLLYLRTQFGFGLPFDSIF